MRWATRDGRVAGVLAAAVFAQGLGLAIMDGLGFRGALQLMVVTGAVAAAVGQTWKVRHRLNHRIDMVLVMLAAGGFGMLVGMALDHGLTAGAETALSQTSPQHHGPSPWSAVGTWMTGLMLLSAVPASLAWTRCADLARSGWRRWVSTHLIGNAAMVVAMVWFGHWFGPALSRLTKGAMTGHHLAMVIGMVIGMEAGMFLGEAVLGLRPWQELEVPSSKSRVKS